MKPQVVAYSCDIYGKIRVKYITSMDFNGAIWRLSGIFNKTYVYLLGHSGNMRWITYNHSGCIEKMEQWNNERLYGNDCDNPNILITSYYHSDPLSILSLIISWGESRHWANGINWLQYPDMRDFMEVDLWEWLPDTSGHFLWSVWRRQWTVARRSRFRKRWWADPTSRMGWLGKSAISDDGFILWCKVGALPVSSKGNT